ncbi:carboxypeptidase M32 [Halapricum hydrolyticum]|uniref:Metal-dependent carboxypeptidase n=1 Tax=Halapricum hydrolyticum TaxID=2979991 RepID=A0AAE3IAX9_9EURY|nr:carboxypeptidase M32 [Halapricum hydrolyticum]MCU4717996.1 carboxypeptidase M32 [Halapricum hydrolyticum]MCU4727161.1 carboxypeptidase M32 [Halapricum hydrolyticum]
MSADTPQAYDDLLEAYRRVSNLESAVGVLSWDQQVTMPDGGAPARSRQLSTLSGLRHELLTDDEVADALDAAAEADLNDEQQAVVREIRREHERAAAVPRELIEQISAKSSEALEVWESAKAESDFSQFAPILEELVELRREYAAEIDPDRDPYAVLFEEYEPYLGLETAEEVLEQLREELVPLIDAVGDSDVTLPDPFADGTYSEQAQEELSREILTDLGYDWERGRLDTSSHPFTSGNQFDCRVTTRFLEDDPLSALTATIHEFGHAFYSLGLPQEEYGTPLGSSRNLSVHESQSRLWENHVGRSRPFWELIEEDVRGAFDGLEDVDGEAFYRAANRVYDDNLIRVDADELTYHMHIVVRFEIERDLVNGDLDVEDVPEVWNDKYEQYLGVRPENDAEGALQDIHWSHGNFGYFPTYTLGSVMAAQLYAAAEDDLGDLDEAIHEGEFEDLQTWLRENVHRHGARYTTDELVELATGESYTADYFLDYVTEKYSELYEL